MSNFEETIIGLLIFGFLYVNNKIKEIQDDIHYIKSKLYDQAYKNENNDIL